MKAKNRREFFKALGVAAGTFSLRRAARAAQGDTQPNIVYIMSDDHALEAISCYGKWLKDYAKTPNIDRIAKEGMRFNTVCCNNSICSPARASILTGQYSHKNGVTLLNGAVNEGCPWVSIGLQKAGYQTAVFGKWHLETRPRGFDDFKIIAGQGDWFDPTFYTPESEYAPKIGKRLTNPQTYKGYSSDVYTDVALEWLGNRDHSKPFCLMLHFKAPHHSYEYPERHEKLLEGVKVPEPANLHEDVAAASPLLKKQHWAQMVGVKQAYYDRHKDDTYPPMEPHGDTEREKASAAYQHMIKKYIRCVTAVDDNVKRVLDYLDQEGLSGNTVVMYSSDQGYWLGQHGFYDKRLILEGSLKIPLLVRYPKEIKPGTLCDRVCSNVDYAPTFLDFAGTPAPEAMQGHSLRPLMRGETPEDRGAGIYYAYWRPPRHWGVRTERYKLIHFAETDEIEFYDMEKDPEEMQNEAKNPEYAPAIAAMEIELKRLMEKLDVKAEDLPGAEKRR